MGCSWCKHCQTNCEKKPEEEKGLLDDTSKCSEDGVQACSKQDDGSQADIDGTQDSRELETEPQQDDVPTGVTVVQVNQVGSEVKNLGTAEHNFSEDTFFKTEDGHTTDHNQKISERNSVDEKSGSGDALYPFCKIENKDPPELEDLWCEPATRTAEGGIAYSPKSENVHRIDFSLQSESIDVAGPSLESDLEGGAVLSLESEPINVEDPSMKCESAEIEEPSLKCEPAELIDASFRSECTDESVDPFFKNENAAAVDPPGKNETVEAVDPAFKKEPDEEVDPAFKNEPDEEVDPAFKNEPDEEVDPAFKNEPDEEVDPSLKYEPDEEVDPSLKNESDEAVDPSLKNEPDKEVDPSLTNEPDKEVDLSLKNDPDEEVDTLFENEPIGETDPSFKNETAEDVETTLDNETIEVVETSFKSQSLQSGQPLPEPQDMKAEDPTPKADDGPTAGPNAVIPDGSPSQTEDELCLGNLSRPAYEDAAELVSGAVHLEVESETPLAVRETPDVNDDSQGTGSSSQSVKPSLLDELAAKESSTTEEEEEEEPVEPEANRTLVLSEAPSLQAIAQDVEEEAGQEDEEKEVDEREEEGDVSETTEGSGKDDEMERKSPAQEGQDQGESTAEGCQMAAGVETEPLTSQHDVASMKEAESFADLYRAEEDIMQDYSEQEKTEPPTDITLPGVEDQCSVAPRVDLLSYSQREWKGNTAKSALIRKGYSELSESFEGLRRVRGDNYCALRATLFQALSHSDKLPAWIGDDDITLLPAKLAAEIEAVESWKFPLGHNEAGEKEGAVEQLKHHLELLQKTWRAVAEAGGAEERRSLCEAAFRGGAEEHALLEAVKLLMLSAAVELHARMANGEDVPVFCWLLFARDSSESPRAFLHNHLSHVGFTGGLEQVEMFLLGYTLQHTVQVYRLYKTDTEEFITYYPDDHKEDWPQVCLVTEDDRHYNVLVGKTEGIPQSPQQKPID